VDFEEEFRDTGEDAKVPRGGCLICPKCKWHIIKGQCGCGDGMSDELRDLLWGRGEVSNKNKGE
jgi:hypothetical protein